ncbi:MAG: hypothetical protein LUD50_03025 [Clostridia bacterium]|nr:hypothetical protein [Clostridia bacterium]
MGSTRMVEKYYPGNYGAPGCPRQKKRQRTPEDIARQNQRNKERKVQRLILANFHEGDWHLILSYRKDERPDSMEAAKKDVQKFLQQMRRAYKKAGKEFRYIYVTERGKRGACHHHLIIEGIEEPELSTTKLVNKLWKHGGKNFTPLYEDGEYENLAEYIVKKETKEDAEGCSYSRSRNLIVPEPKKEIIHARRWRQEPKPPKGWVIAAGSLENGYNPVTGYPYQHYTLKQLGGSG